MDKVAEEKIKSLARIEGLFDGGTSVLDANYHCVPVFLNFIRDRCSWLLSGKAVCGSPVKISKCVQNSTAIDCFNKSDHGTETPDVSPCELDIVKNITPSNHKLVKRRNFSYESKAGDNSGTSFGISPESPGTYVSRKLDLNETPKSSRAVQKFSLGCESYRRKDGKKYQRSKTGSPSPTSVANSPAPDISSVDLFPPVGSACAVSSKSGRRITPTPLHPQNGERSRGFSRVLSTIPANRQWKNALFSDTPLQDEKDPKLKCEREMLKTRRCELTVPSSVPTTVAPPSLSVEEPESVAVEPDPSKVCDSNKLDVLADAYCHCLEHGLVPNVAGEIYFMFQILTSVGKVGEISNGNDVLGTVHDCVYFAVTVLNQQRKLLSILDDRTLKTFAEIPYLPDFSKKLFHFVKTLRDEHLLTRVPKSPPVPQVFFQVDTDNRNNFPNDLTFHSFRKQRDLFYEVLRDWQQQNVLDPQFQYQFKRKVQHLVSIGTETINYVHLARLLQSQLVASCLGTSESVESYSGALGDIKRSFPDRIEKLESRFLNPSKTGGTGPSAFYGIQTFFCEFIHAASSIPLNQHLLDILAYKILELNDREFLHLASESDNQDEDVSEYSSALNTLRLLAKFLGYLVYMPYKDVGFVSHKLVAFQLELRKCTNPLLDVEIILQNALSRQTLVLTVPWIVDYLGMMDPVAMCLDYNKRVFYTLVDIYKGKFQNQMSAENLVFLKLVIGWLFDSPNFPQQLIFSLNPNQDVKENSSSARKNIDTFLKIDKQLMYSCCPHLVELKFLLDDYINGIKTTREVRKIKPVPTSPITSPGFSNHLIEQQLEENFFLLHSPSVKKTVEFVADRIASRIIQRVRKEVQAMKLVAVSAVYGDPEFPVDKKTKQNREKIAEIVHRKTNALCGEAKQMAWHLSDSQCLPEIEKIIPQLISEDTRESVLKTCCEISARLAINKVMEWSETNIIPECIAPDIKSKVEHSLKDSTASPNPAQHSGAQLTSNRRSVPAEALNSLRNIAISLHAGKQDVSVNQVLELLSSIKSTCEGEKGIGILKTVVILTVDIMLSLIARIPWLCSDEIISTFVSFWTVISPSAFSADEILCPRNVQILYENGDSALSWCLFQLLLEHLLTQKVFTPEQFEACVSSVSSAKLNQSSLERFTPFVQGVLESFVSLKDKCTEPPPAADAAICDLNNEAEVQRHH